VAPRQCGPSHVRDVLEEVPDRVRLDDHGTRHARSDCSGGGRYDTLPPVPSPDRESTESTALLPNLIRRVEELLAGQKAVDEQFEALNDAVGAIADDLGSLSEEIAQLRRLVGRARPERPLRAKE